MVIDKELQERFRKSEPKQFSNGEQLKKDRELLERFNSSVKNKYIFNPVELLAAQERVTEARVKKEVVGLINNSAHHLEHLSTELNEYLNQ